MLVTTVRPSLEDPLELLKDEALMHLGQATAFKALTPPKRGAARESISDAANSLRRAFIDQVLATDESLRAAWRYGCELFNNACYICGDSSFAKGELQADHVLPPVLGGSGNAGNLLPAHSGCNTHKGDEHPDSYFKDRPVTLARIRHLQEKFNFVSDPDIYALAHEKVSGYLETIKQDIIHTRNERELSREDSGEDAVERKQLLLSPEVKNLMRAVEYYLEAQAFAPTAKSKVLSYSRRILHSWYSDNDTDLFTQDELALQAFIQRFFLGLTDHSDAFNRAHRAFRILGEVFKSTGLINIYAEGAPLTLTGMRETHSYTSGGWLPQRAVAS